MYSSNPIPVMSKSGSSQRKPVFQEYKPIFPLPIDGGRSDSTKMGTTSASSYGRAVKQDPTAANLNAQNYVNGKIYKRVKGANAMELVEDTAGKQQVKSAYADYDNQKKQLDDLIVVVKRERKAVSHLRKGALETLKKWADAQDDYNREVRGARTRMEIWEANQRLIKQNAA